MLSFTPQSHRNFVQNTLHLPCTGHLPFFFEENCNLYLHLLMAVKDMRIGMNIHSIHREQAILSVFGRVSPIAY